MHLLDILVYVDAHKQLRGLVDAICMVALGLSTMAPFLKHPVSARPSFWQRPWLFIVLMTISLFACRYPVLFYPRNLSPDEAQLIAQAITYETHPVPWRDIDGNSGGPIDSYMLLWCLPFGLQPDYLTARILELFCVLGMFIFLYWAGRRVAGDPAARLALMPAFLFICWNSYPDFTHYSSEEVSIFLIGWALYLITKLRRTPGTISSTIQLGLVLGLLPFAKLQSVLLGGFLGLSAIWFLCTSRHGNRRAALSRILILIASALVPTVLILSIVAWAGALNDFWISYIRMAQFYGTQYPSLWGKLNGMADVIAWILKTTTEPAIPNYLLGISSIVLGLHLLFGNQRITRAARNWFIWAVLLAVTSVATVLFPGQKLLHYQFFLLPGLTFLMAVNFRLVGLSRPGPVASNAAMPLLLTAMLSCLLITASMLFKGWNDPMIAVGFPWLIGLCLVLAIGWPVCRAVFAKPSFLPPSHWQKFMPLACLIPFFIIPVLILSCQPNGLRGKVEMCLGKPLPAMDQAILRDRPPGGRLALWGWSAEFAAETETPLGTRDAITSWNLPENPLRDYYRQRYLRDLRANRPELFLEATGPHNFALSDPKLYGIETFPELAKLISEQYRLDQEIEGMRLFMRNDLLKAESNAGQETR